MSNVQEKHAWHDLSDRQKIEVLKKRIDQLDDIVCKLMNDVGPSITMNEIRK